MRTLTGRLYDVPAPPKSMFLPIVSRIKILSGLDIAVSRKPQHGRCLPFLWPLMEPGIGFYPDRFSDDLAQVFISNKKRVFKPKYL